MEIRQEVSIQSDAFKRLNGIHPPSGLHYFRGAIKTPCLWLEIGETFGESFRADCTYTVYTLTLLYNLRWTFWRKISWILVRLGER